MACTTHPILDVAFPHSPTLPIPNYSAHIKPHPCLFLPLPFDLTPFVYQPSPSPRLQWPLCNNYSHVPHPLRFDYLIKAFKKSSSYCIWKYLSFGFSFWMLMRMGGEGGWKRKEEGGMGEARKLTPLGPQLSSGGCRIIFVACNNNVCSAEIFFQCLWGDIPSSTWLTHTIVCLMYIIAL